MGKCNSGEDREQSVGSKRESHIAERTINLGKQGRVGNSGGGAPGGSIIRDGKKKTKL